MKRIRCQFCGTFLGEGEDRCGNCGAPAEPDSRSPLEPAEEPAVVVENSGNSASTQTTVTARTPSGGGCGSRLLIAIIVAAVLIPILAAIAIPALMNCARRSREARIATATPEEMGAVLTPAPTPDSVYRAVLVEGENTVETVWPRVLLDCPDSCSWLEPYQPSAAFLVEVRWERPLCRFYATAPFDLVMAVLERRDDGTLGFLRYDDDTVGRDPQIDEILHRGEYIVIVAPLSSFDTGGISFVLEILQEEVPVLPPDTVFTTELSELDPRAVYFVEIRRDSVYTIQAASDDLDTFVELRTGQGAVLSDDDGGGGWSDSRL
ncbi:hypothetical protein GX411_09470, partial [Candidatus Fermentibacteria bacterium]|nr:hypothetical protein [Candidatus Fermentibacteria bacterium]